MNKGFFIRLVQHWNPNAYSDLVDEKLVSSVRHFFVHFGVLFLVMAFLFVPAYFINADSVTARLGSFSEASFDASFESDGPVALLENPTVVFDMNATSADDAQVVFGAGGVHYKKYYWFGQDTLSYNETKDLTTVDSRLVGMVGVFLLPALVFWSGFYVLVKTLALVVLFSVLGWVLAGAFKQSITYPRSLQVAFYAAIPAVMVELLLFPFWRNAWVSFILYLLLFVLGVALISERKVGGRKKKSFED